MHPHPSTRLPIAIATLLLTVPAAQAATTVFSESFGSTTITLRPNGYLGGWFTPQVALQQWNGPSEATITTGALQISPTNGFRSAGILLGPSVFTGAGDYTLTFDLASYSGDGNDQASVSIWSGSGYGAPGSTGNSLILDTLTGTLKTTGTASATSLASMTLNAAATDITLNFTYDGTSTVALFFGASTGGWPFPVARYDNIRIDSVAAQPAESIPEPMGAAGLASLAAGAALFSRRRR